MAGLGGLGSLLGDPELRSLIADLASRKIRADLKTLEAHAELARRLSANRRRGDEEGAALKPVIREHLEYYGTLVEMSYAFHQRLLDLLADRGEASVAGAAIHGTRLELRGSPGGTAVGRFTVFNGRAEPVSVTCRASPFVSEDGSQLVASGISFDPPVGEIAPGTEAVFHAAVPVGPDLLVGRAYLATLGAEGVEEVNIVARLTVEEPIASDAPDAEAPDRSRAAPRARKRRDGTAPAANPAVKRKRSARTRKA